MGRSDEKAIEESLRGPDDETSHRRERRERAPHRNPLCRALQVEHPHWTDPPGDDALLTWRFRFGDGDMALLSGSLGGVGVHTHFDDGRSKQARVLGKLDGPNAVARARSVDALLALLQKLTVDVLRLTYGPLRYVTGSPYWHSQVVHYLGHRAPVMPLTQRCAKQFGQNYASAGRWILSMVGENGQKKIKAAHAEEIAALDREAEALIFKSSNEWRDVRGRRRNVERRADTSEDA